MLAKIRVVRRWSDRQRSRPDRLVGPESLILSPEKMQAIKQSSKKGRDGKTGHLRVELHDQKSARSIDTCQQQNSGHDDFVKLTVKSRLKSPREPQSKRGR